MSAIVATRPSLAEMIDPKRTALVIIDVQVDLGAPDGLYGKVGCDLSRVEPAIDHMIELHDAARRAGVFTVFVRLETGPATDSMPAQERRLRNGTNNGGPPSPPRTPAPPHYPAQPPAAHPGH